MDFDAVTEWYRNNAALIGEGIYFVGEDIVPANYGIKCQSSSMNLIVFDTEEDYYNYHHMSRFTYGEENDAIKANASQNDYIYEGDEKALKLKAGNVLRIKDIYVYMSKQCTLPQPNICDSFGFAMRKFGTYVF